MDTYQVPHPNFTPNDENQVQLLKLFFKDQSDIEQMWLRTSSPYLPWDRFSAKYRQGKCGLGDNFSMVRPEEAWFLLGLRRKFGSQSVDITDVHNRSFTWSRLPSYEKDLRDFDMQLGGNLPADTFSDGKGKKERFLRQGLIEEAIASSQLEGAAMTRERAKKMIAENRKPISHDEWMIFNNYQTIKKIESEIKNYDLSREVLLDLHVLMTKNAIEPDKMGRWRRDEDDIVVLRAEGPVEYVAHVPPNEEILHRELDRLIAFANDESDNDSEGYVHPIVKAILIHFWFGYLHPFADGNGRLARSLFYWYLLRHDYWLISYIPISRVIKKSPIQYADAYAYSEQYDNDLTYFIDYNFRKLQHALNLFKEYLLSVKEKSQTIDSIIPDQDLNVRQKQVVHHLLGKPEDMVTARRHADFHEVGWLTASQDLKDLKARGYLDTTKKGREVFYGASEKLKAFLE